jgi:hypothetical protein
MARFAVAAGPERSRSGITRGKIDRPSDFVGLFDAVVRFHGLE